MKKIVEIIKNNQNGIVLFLGRVTNFTPDEISNFLEAQGMQYADKYRGEELALVVLSSMITPLEEELSYELYDLKVPDVRLDEFEKFYTQHIKPNTLMMSLKLSNDQERLKRLLKNESFSDEVYLKLFKMYDWGDDGVYDNDDNRDVTISFVSRFYHPDGFRDPAMVYSPITLSNIARDAKTSEVINAMLSMPNHEIKQSRKEDFRPKNLREIVALNENISQEDIRYLLSFNNDRINSFLASNNAIKVNAQEHIFTKADGVTKLMLTQNNSLDDGLFKAFLTSDSEIVKSLLTFQKITKNRLKDILEANLEEDILAMMGENSQIDEVVMELIGINQTLDYKLSSNKKVNQSLLNEIYKRYGDAFALALAQNPNLEESLLRAFYEKGEGEVLFSLASNPTTPKDILKELCERDEHELNCHLAVNPSVELYYLEIFALDTELVALMSTNQTYLESRFSAHLGEGRR